MDNTTRWSLFHSAQLCARETSYLAADISPILGGTALDADADDDDADDEEDDDAVEVVARNGGDDGAGGMAVLSARRRRRCAGGALDIDDDVDALERLPRIGLRPGGSRSKRSSSSS